MGVWSASLPGRALPPGKKPPVPTGQEAGWAPEPVWTQTIEEKSSASVGDGTPVVQSVIRHYTARATTDPQYIIVIIIKIIITILSLKIYKSVSELGTWAELPPPSSG
jgi:hypothetical protein